MAEPKFIAAPKPFSRVLAVHEAGHAVATICTREFVDAVHLRTSAQMRAGDKIITERGHERIAEGYVEGSTRFAVGMLELFPDHPRPPDDDIHEELVVLFAGPAAEAKHSRASVNKILMFGGGRGDLAAVDRIVRLLNVSAELQESAEAEAHKLVRREWRGILAVADLIQPNRWTSGELVHRAFAKGVLHEEA